MQSGNHHLETYYSHDVDGRLPALYWDDIRTSQQLWVGVFAILEALRAMSERLAEVSGRLTVETCDANTSALGTSADWRVVLTPEGVASMQQRVSQGVASKRELLPYMMVLRTSPTIFLPETVTELHRIAFDGPELEDWGPLPMAPANFADLPAGMRAWRLSSALPASESIEEDALLYFRIVFALDQDHAQICLRPHSPLDVWSATRFDGTPNGPHGAHNADLLRDTLERLKIQSGATRIE